MSIPLIGAIGGQNPFGGLGPGSISNVLGQQGVTGLGAGGSVTSSTTSTGPNGTTSTTSNIGVPGAGGVTGTSVTTGPNGTTSVTSSTGVAGSGGPTGPTGPVGPTLGSAGAAPATGGFESTLAAAVDNLQAQQTDSDEKNIEAVTTGNLDDIQDATIAAARVQTTVQLVAAVRNQAVDAFNEIMRMGS